MLYVTESPHKDIYMCVYVCVSIRSFSAVSRKLPICFLSPVLLPPPHLSLWAPPAAPDRWSPHRLCHESRSPDASCEVSAGIGSNSTQSSAVCSAAADPVWFDDERQQHILPQGKTKGQKSKLWSHLSFSPFKIIPLLHLNCWFLRNY